MAVKDRHNGKYDVELKGKHVKRLYDADAANMLYYSGKRLLELGKPLDAVIAELRGDSDRTPTLDDYFESWLPRSIKPQSATRYRNSYKMVSQHIGKMRLDRVDAAVLKRLAGDLGDERAPHTTHQAMTLIKTMLSDACDEKVIADRPPRRVKNMPRAENVRKTFALTREQHKAVVSAAPDHYRTLFAVWPLIGLRLGEMTGLRWEDIEGDKLYVRRQVAYGRVSKPKTPSSIRYVDLPSEAIAALGAWHAVNPCPLVFPSAKGGHMTWTPLRKAIADAGTVVGLPLRSHIFRHTFGSWLLEAGARIDYVAARMGHKDAAMLLKVYAHELEDADQRAPLLFDAWLKEQRGDGEK